MTNHYEILSNLIFVHNRKLYSKLNFAWDKTLTIQYLLFKIPDLKTSYISELKTNEDIVVLNLGKIKQFVLKNSFGHSARSVLVFKKVKNKKDLYFETIRNKYYTVKEIILIIKNFNRPFIERVMGTGSLPYDIKVHIFFGKICFFYIYKKGNKNECEKSRYDGNLNYIDYSKMFYPNSFKDHSHFKENKNLINTINMENLQKVLEYSLKIFEKAKNNIFLV